MSLSKAELNQELNKKRTQKTNRLLKAYNKINIYQMKHQNNLCQKKELVLDLKKDCFMIKNRV